MIWRAGLILALLLGGATATLGRSGTLRSRTGTTFRGEIRLEPTGQLLVEDGTNQPVRVGLADLEQLTLAPETRLETPARVPGGAGLPAPWLGRQIGLFASPGKAVFDAGKFIVQGGGAEGFYFVHQPLAGNGELVAQITSTLGGETGARAGLMARQALTDDAPFAWIGVNQNGKATVLTRAATGKTAPQLASVEFAVPGWLKLVRNANRVSLHTSRDNRQWDLVGAETLLANAPFFVGLAVSSGNSHELNRAVFENVTLALAPREPAAQAVTLRNGTTLPASIRSVNDVTIEFTSYGRSFTFPLLEVARVWLRPVPPEKLAGLPPGRRGVLLASGDFLDGEITGLESKKVKISSVLFGQREYQLPTDVAGLVCRELRPPAMPWLARSVDGLVLQSKTAILQGDRFLFEDEIVGAFGLPFSELIELKRQTR